MPYQIPPNIQPSIVPDASALDDGLLTAENFRKLASLGGVTNAKLTTNVNTTSGTLATLIALTHATKTGKFSVQFGCQVDITSDVANDLIFQLYVNGTLVAGAEAVWTDGSGGGGSGINRETVNILFVVEGVAIGDQPVEVQWAMAAGGVSRQGSIDAGNPNRSYCTLIAEDLPA